MGRGSAHQPALANAGQELEHQRDILVAALPAQG
jgi:hypothetical protein